MHLAKILVIANTLTDLRVSLSPFLFLLSTTLFLSTNLGIYTSGPSASKFSVPPKILAAIRHRGFQMPSPLLEVSPPLSLNKIFPLALPLSPYCSPWELHSGLQPQRGPIIVIREHHTSSRWLTVVHRCVRSTTECAAWNWVFLDLSQTLDITGAQNMSTTSRYIYLLMETKPHRMMDSTAYVWVGRHI